MKIDISLSTKSIESKIALIEREFPREIDNALAKTAFYGSNIIQDRTNDGRGLKGMFKKYTPEYAEFRREKGRGSKVDLNFTGQMMGAMTVTKGRGYAEIRFNNALANKKAYFNNRTRPFFGFQVKERRQLIEFMKRRLFG